MEIRVLLNKHKAVSLVVSLGAIALVLISICMRSRGTSIPKQLNFYTTDDGATLFSDDSQKAPPFDHGGQQALRAVVFTCDDGKHQFVQYLQKYSDEVKQQMERSHSFGAINIALIKRPGDAKWILESDPKAERIERPKCPDGSYARPVYP